VSGDLRRAAYRGGRWGLASSLLQQLGSMATTLLLARRLTPAEFGIVAAAQAVIGLTMLITDAGLGASIVAAGERDERTLASLWWVSVGAGVAGFAIVAGASQPIAAALGVTAAAPYLVASAATLVSTMAQVVPRALLSRDLRFEAMYGADLAGAGVYFVVQTVLVLATDLGAWVVILGLAAMDLTKLVWTLAAAAWRPVVAFDREAVAPHLRFGVRYLATTLAGYASRSVDIWAAGRLLGAPALGAYYIAFVLPTVVRQRFTFVLNQVGFPVLARITDTAQLRSSFLELATMVTLPLLPALTGLALVAEPVVEVFFGDQWDAAVAPLRLLALAAAVDALSALAMPLLMSRSRTGVVLRIQLLRVGALVIGLLVVWGVGGDLSAIAAAVLVAAALALVASILLSVPLLELRPPDLVRVVWPALVPTIAMVAAVGTLLPTLPADLHAAARLVALVGVGVAVHQALAWTAFRATYLTAVREGRRLLVGR